MSEPDLLSEVHPVADLCSHFRDPEPTTVSVNGAPY
ncbi:Uncharacterised protein [Escherichia coli]|nr:Uncharacterised protein [Escherichia coli]